MGEAATAYPYNEPYREMRKQPPRKSSGEDLAAKYEGFLVTVKPKKANLADPYKQFKQLNCKFLRRNRQTELVPRVDWLPVNLTGKFENLATQWRKETKFLSSITDKVLHPCYQRIIGLGPDAIPIILAELRKNGGHWFWALESITGENPVLPEHHGDIKEMTLDWIEWGKHKGY